CKHNWRNGGPRRAFVIFHSETGALMGSIEASFAFRSRAVTPLALGQVNLSIGIFADWRRQGVAKRALRLMAQYLATNTDAKEMILRIAPENQASIRLAESAGFELLGTLNEAHGPMQHYSRRLTR